MSAALIGGTLYFVSDRTASSDAQSQNIEIRDGVQYVTITAKGKYTPKLTAAKAGMPTVLRVETNGTFDCTSQLTVPSVGFRQMLPPTGKTDIELGAQTTGATVRGICSMGMYNFEVRFN